MAKTKGARERPARAAKMAKASSEDVNPEINRRRVFGGLNACQLVPNGYTFDGRW